MPLNAAGFHLFSMHTLLQDLRQSTRALARQPLFAGMAVASLALGIGLSTVIFSVVYGLLLRPLPYPQPEALVHIGLGKLSSPDEGAFGGLPSKAFQALRDDPHSGLSALGAFTYNYANLTGVPTPVQLTAGSVSTGYFRVYGVPVALGRTFTEADASGAGPLAVILSHALWRTQFHADAGIVGRTIALDGRPLTVVGVMGADFTELNGGVELWMPLCDASPEMAPNSPRRFITTARLADPGADGRTALRASLGMLTARLAQDDPVHFKEWHLAFDPLAGNLLIGFAATKALYLLLGAVGCVLLVTCANVANLQLVRAAARRRETGVRLALGASRARIMRGAFTESLVLAGLASARWAACSSRRGAWTPSWRCCPRVIRRCKTASR